MEKKTLFTIICVSVFLNVITVGFFEKMGNAISKPAGDEQNEYADYTTIRVYADDAAPHVNVVAKPITDEMLAKYKGEI
jgi:hypothetical protein